VKRRFQIAGIFFCSGDIIKSRVVHFMDPFTVKFYEGEGLVFKSMPTSDHTTMFCRALPRDLEDKVQQKKQRNTNGLSLHT